MRHLVPGFIIEKHARGELDGEFPAVILFADITDFSIITESLMKHGQHGAEVLASLMCDIFEPMITSVYHHGGFISTLAGDAITAVFPVDELKKNTVLHAFASSWEIQTSVRNHLNKSDHYGRFEISARVGLAVGSIEWGIITSKNQLRSAYYFRGSAIDKCAEVERQAGSGKIVVDENIFNHLQDYVNVSKVGEFYRIADLKGELQERQSFVKPDIPIENMASFFPKNLVGQTHSGEFRQVVNLFIKLPTIRTKVQLQIFMRSLFLLQHQYGGLLNRLDFGDKGAHLLLFWGAPVTYENDVERAMNFSLALQEITSTPIHAGMTYSISHVGFIGCELREEYTCHGQGVNLAARFMEAAPRGNIWIDQSCAKRAEKHHLIEFVRDQHFKGFSQPQPVYSLQERRDAISTIFRNKLVGRQEELDQLASFVLPIREGQFCGALVIWGEAGIGKSHLVHELEGSVVFEAGDVLWARCQTDQLLREAFNPFRYWLKLYFGVSETQGSARNKRNFTHRLENLIADIEDINLVEKLNRARSFLGAFLGLHWPDSLYELSEGQVRYNNTLTGLTTLLLAESKIQPVIIQLEDVHWLDSDSQMFISHLFDKINSTGSNGYPIAIIATARPEGQSNILGKDIPYSEIFLGSLSEKDVENLAENILPTSATPQLLQLIKDHASGNPFFIEQIVRFLLEQDSLTLDRQGLDIGTTDKFPLPTDVRAILVARLDQLGGDLKEMVHFASVLGREFDTHILLKMLNNELDLTDTLLRGEQKAIWTTLSKNRYIFNHALMQEAAYRMQISTQREKLHERAISALESAYSKDLSPHYGELAYHSENAGDYHRAFNYFRLAAERAANNYANQEAITAYSDAIKLIGNVSPKPAVVANLHRERGHALEFTGEFDQARSDYENCQVIAHDQGELIIEWQTFVDLGKLWASRDYNHTRDYFEQALELARQVNDPAVLAGSLNWMGNLHANAEDPINAVAYHQKALDIFEVLGSQRDLADTLDLLGIANLLGGDTITSVHYYDRAIALFRELDDRPRLAASLIGRAATVSIPLPLASVSAAPSLDVSCYVEEALQITKEIGSSPDEAWAYWVLGHLHLVQGHFGNALKFMQSGLRLASEIGHREYMVASRFSLGILYSELFTLDRARGQLEEALALVGELRSPVMTHLVSGALAGAYLMLDDLKSGQACLETVISPQTPMDTMGKRYCWARRAELALSQGDPALALDIINRLIASVPSMSPNCVITFLWKLRGETLAAMGQADEAIPLLQVAIENARETEERYLLWSLHASLGRLYCGMNQHTEAETALSTASRLIKELADTLPDGGLKDNFLQGAHNTLVTLI